MRSLQEGIVRLLSGAGGLVAAVLSGLSLTIAAVAGPVVGLLALAITPLRALLERLRRLRA